MKRWTLENHFSALFRLIRKKDRFQNAEIQSLLLDDKISIN